MSIENAANFRKMISADGNEDLKAKAQEAAAMAVHRADSMGVTLSIDDAYSLAWVRIVALTGAEIGDLSAEIEATPAGRKIAEDREIMAALHDSNNDAARKHAAEEAIAAEMAKLRPADRMTRARQMGATFTPPADEKRKLTAAEKAIELKRLESMPAAMRMQRARELGL